MAHNLQGVAAYFLESMLNYEQVEHAESIEELNVIGGAVGFTLSNTEYVLLSVRDEGSGLLREEAPVHILIITLEM